MKKISLTVAALGVAAFLLSPVAFAAAGPGPKAKIFAEFDANKNGAIDGAEIVAVRKAFAADLKGQFVGYDVNNDGKLDDNEIAAIKPPGAKKDGEKKTGEKKTGEKKTGEKKGGGKKKSTDAVDATEKAEKTDKPDKP